MDVTTFERAAEAAAPHIAAEDKSVGERIRTATDASVAATGLNANLGIILLCAPLAKAAAEIDIGTGLRRRLATILSVLTKDDARDAFAAIRRANPAGLGKVDDGDVSNDDPGMTLIQAMHLAADRDRIAQNYVTAYEDIFDLALPAYNAARTIAAQPDLTVTTLHMTLLSKLPDSHIARKFGMGTADKVRQEALDRAHLWSPVATLGTRLELLEFDADLKARGLNPGTTADLVVATLFAAAISAKKRSR
jgi:triphosphoribosyl-dephospho-CoA synthase